MGDTPGTPTHHPDLSPGGTLGTPYHPDLDGGGTHPDLARRMVPWVTPTIPPSRPSQEVPWVSPTINTWDGVPPSRPDWGVSRVPPTIQTWDGVTPLTQTWDGVPPRPGMGYLPDVGWGTPTQTWDGVTPHPDLGWGTPPRSRWGLTNKLKTVPSPILRMRAVKEECLE